MGILRIADITATTRIEHESGDWIEVKSNLAKRDINAILLALPPEVLQGGSEFSYEAAVGSAEALFSALVVGWSLDMPPTVESYLSLTGDGAAWIDSSLYTHFNSLTMSEDERGKPSPSASD
jgi:hypothetical protein